MPKVSLAKLAALAIAALTAVSCASKPEPAEPGIDINLGPFGPRIRVSGLDHNDATPAAVDVGH